MPAVAGVLWGKVDGNPWWPCRAAKYDTGVHGALDATSKQAEKKGAKFVVFFDRTKRQSWAWLAPKNVKPFAKHASELGAKCRSARFKAALSLARKELPPGEGAAATAIKQEIKQEKGTGGTKGATPPAAGARSTRATRATRARDDETPTAVATAHAADDGGGGGGEAEAEAGSDAGVGGFDHGMSEYELQRRERLRQNQAMLTQLGIGVAKAGMNMHAISASTKAALKATRGIQTKRVKRKAPVLPPRKSSRIKGEQADDMYVTSERGGKIYVANMPDAMKKLATAETALQVYTPSSYADTRLPEETLTLESTGGTTEFGAEFMSTLKKLSAAAKKSGAAAVSSKGLDYAGRMAKLSLGEEGVAKVTPDRVYSIAAHPSSSNLIVAVGDKCGNLGLWNVDQQDGETSGVINFHPHTACINFMKFADSANLITQSYDGTIRCMDINKNVSDFVCSTPAEDDGWLQTAALSTDGNLVYMADSQGVLTCVDRRTGANVYRVQGHIKKINTISVNPVEENIIATASLDRTVKIWDTRKLAKGKGKSAKEIAILPEPKERSINSAAFSPSGSKLLTVSQSNFLRLYVDAHKKSGIVEVDNSCHHDNKTGRYLPVFHAAWDPKSDHAFVIGSMSRPRQVEIYTTDSNKMRRVMSLQDPEYLGSVQSRNCFHPTQDIVCCGNASGRVHIFR